MYCPCRQLLPTLAAVIICVLLVNPTWPQQVAKPWQQPGSRLGEEIVGPDGAAMVWVPGGSFTMGSSIDEWRYRLTKLFRTNRVTEETPAHQVTLDGFWVQKLEVTNAQFARFLNDYGSNQDPEGHMLLDLEDTGCEIVFTNGRYQPVDGRAKHPVVEVTWYGARAYAQHYGLALPTEAQWEYAARGPKSLRYPWGNEWHDNWLCWTYHRGPGTAFLAATFPVGSFPEGASWCGALDMAGNALEWCADWYDFKYYRRSPGTNPPGPAQPPESGSEPQKVCRGGSYFHNTDDCRSARRLQFPPAQCNDYHGFRCVANLAAPATG